jgi:lipopolysaccharide transport system ATP-binding protein
VQRLCSRVLWLDGGRLRMDGPPREVTEAYFDSMIGTREPTRGIPLDVPDGPAELPPESSQAPAGPVDDVPDGLDARAVGALPRGAHIRDVRLVDGQGRAVTSIRGGEHVWLLVDAVSHGPIAQPIIGFYVKDRLGQQLFGENTLSRPDHPGVGTGTRFGARFGFVMPRLFPGDYLVAVAIAEGTQASHVHHEWRHEAWLFTSAWTGGATGLVGIDVDVRWIGDARSASVETRSDGRAYR